eukprot:6549279-Prymnesium_polylepis.1
MNRQRHSPQRPGAASCFRGQEGSRLPCFVQLHATETSLVQSSSCARSGGILETRDRDANHDVSRANMVIPTLQLEF